MSVRPRVAMVTPNYHPRTCGVGDNAMRLGLELLRRGYDTKIFTHAPAEPHPEAPQLEVFGANGKTPAGHALLIARELDRWQPTQVLIQYTPQMLETSRFGSAAIPLLVAWARRKWPVSVLAHELYLPWSPRPDLALGAWNHRSQLIPLLHTADKIWVTTPSRQRSLEKAKRLVGGRAQLGVIPIGPNATPLKAVRSPGGLRLGLFSSLAFGKRFDVVLDAFAEVAPEFPRTELRLIGDLGDDSSPKFRKLREAIERHPASKRITLTGKLSLDEVAREVARLDLYLFPMDTGATTRSSTLPIALGAGVPVIAVNGRETSDLFRDGENVLFSAHLTGPAFAEAVRRLARERALADRIAQGGADLFDQHLTWPRIADTLLA